MSVLRAGVLLFILTCISWPLHAQQEPEPVPPPGAQPVHIFAVGQFLGQFDGMPEYPGHVRWLARDAKEGVSRPYGGILGVKEKLQARTASDILLISGDNHPHPRNSSAHLQQQLDSLAAVSPVLDVWNELAALKPSAVALWSEDFYRALSQPGSVTSFVALARRPDLRALATNVAVRKHATNLNTVKVGPLTLEGVPRTSSIGWNASLKVALPCSGANHRFLLTGQMVGAPKENVPDVRGELTQAATAGVCHVTPDTGPLRPDTHYQLAISTGGGTLGELAFWTDAALTPVSSMDGLPIAKPHEDPAQPLIISMVDPGVRKRLPQDRWEWQHSPTEKREIVFVDPSDALQAVRGWVAKYNERFFALMAGLNDTDITSLLESTEVVRFVVLPADSNLLGRAADERRGPERADKSRKMLLSGDRGYAGLFEHKLPPLARAWLRPEWTGETILEASAWAVREVSTAPAPPWSLWKLDATSTPVEGYRLCAKTTGTSTPYNVVEYRAVTMGAAAPASGSHVVARAVLYPAYDPAASYGLSGNTQGGLWIDEAEFAALALDTMRSALRAELAILPANFVDSSYVAYLDEEYSELTGRLDWLSREVLGRMLFRADQVVRVRLTGKDLLTAVAKILDATDVCVAGFDSTTCGLAKLDSAHLLLNGRPLVATDYYGVAMPESMATEQGLRADKGSRYLLDLVESAFKESKHTVDTCGPVSTPAPARPGERQDTPRALAAELESAYQRKVQPFFRQSPLELSFSRTEVHEPAGKNGTLAGVPVSSSGAKDKRAFSGKLEVDAGLDWLHYTLRAIGTAAYGEEEVEELRTSDISRVFNPDEYRYGVRFDWKLSRTAPSTRLFFGGFERGEFKAARIPGLDIRRRHHRHAAVGFEADDVFSRKYIKVKQLRAFITRGKEFAEREALKLNGLAVPLTYDLSEAKRQFKDDHKIDATTAEYDFRDAWKTGLETDYVVAVPLHQPPGRDAAELLFTLRSRRYVTDPALLLAEKRNLYASAEATFPIGRGWAVTLKVEREHIEIQNGDRFSVGGLSTVFKLPLFWKRGAGIIW